MIFSSLMLSAQENEIDFGKNRFEVGIGYSNFDGEESGIVSTFSYERLFGTTGKLGLEVKGKGNFYTDSEVIMYTVGPNLNWYPFGEGRWLYLGPSLGFGFIGDEYDSSFVISAGINVGYQVQFTRLFGMKFGLNYDYLEISDSENNFGNYQAMLGWNFSF